MKCPACGYTDETKTETVDDVIRYKSGKRKGEIKEVKTKEITLKIGHESFQEFCISHCKVRRWGKPDTWGHSLNESDELSFNVCPECGCMFIARS